MGLMIGCEASKLMMMIELGFPIGCATLDYKKRAVS